MIRLTIGNVTVQADSQSELDAAVQELCLPLTEKEMAVFAGVSVRTIGRWKSERHFPRPKSGIVTRHEFFAFLSKRISSQKLPKSAK